MGYPAGLDSDIRLRHENVQLLTRSRAVQKLSNLSIGMNKDVLRQASTQITGKSIISLVNLWPVSKLYSTGNGVRAGFVT